MPRSALKRKYHSEMSDVRLNGDGNRKTTKQFNDMCDDVIDKILCDLELEDLANVADTSARLRRIAGSVFSRRHAHCLISIDAFHYTRSLTDKLRESYEQARPMCSKDKVIVSVSDINVWFKLVRNFGASIKYVRVQTYNYETNISGALGSLIKYISEFCADSLETLQVDRYPSFMLPKPLTKLQEFCFHSQRHTDLNVLEWMPNLRAVTLGCIPKTLAKHYATLERVDLLLDTDEEVETFISFVRLNPQIKYLRLCLYINCRHDHNVSIYSAIRDNLTQLTTLKLYELNDEPEVTSRYRFKTVESFSISYGHARHVFEFDDLKKVALGGSNAASPYCMKFLLRNKKLRILKLGGLDAILLDGAVIRNLLNELPELEQILVHSFDPHRYSILKSHLGREWELFEKEQTGRFQPTPDRFQRFQKIKSTT